MRLRVVADQAGSKHAGDSRNRAKQVRGTAAHDARVADEATGCASGELRACPGTGPLTCFGQPPGRLGGSASAPATLSRALDLTLTARSERARDLRPGRLHLARATAGAGVLPSVCRRRRPRGRGAASGAIEAGIDMPRTFGIEHSRGCSLRRLACWWMAGAWLRSVFVRRPMGHASLLRCTVMVRRW
jgi:hypothetical protein